MNESNSVQSRKSKPAAKLSEQVYESLLGELTAWQFQPGDILVEDELAQRFDTSRTPVREALRVLVADGFLRVVPKTGYIVLPLTPKDVREMYFMRLLLEGEAAALAAERIAEPEVQQIMQELESLCLEIQRQEPDGQKLLQTSRIIDHNTAFHLAVARAAGNGRLVEAISKLMQEIKRVRLYYEGIGLESFAQAHLELLADIRSGDPERARSAMRQHVEMGRTDLMRAFG